ncbi:hypothetical protein MKW92_022344 [Papaver armeniacum]|nr:hypothetical protein MKW92_022344 [Papaver armeniacum]
MIGPFQLYGMIFRTDAATSNPYRTPGSVLQGSGVPGGQEIVFGMFCHLDEVGSSIGKGGLIMRALQSDTGASIKIADAEPDSDVGFEAGAVIVARILVPSQQICCLLGKGGSIIAEMRRSAGASMHIFSKDASMHVNQNATDVMSIAGYPDSPASKDVIAEEASLFKKAQVLRTHMTRFMIHPLIVPTQTTKKVELQASDSDSIKERESRQTSVAIGSRDEHDPDKPTSGKSSPSKAGDSKVHRDEDSEIWQRIIRLDAARSSGEWIVYSPTQVAWGLKDYDHLEPCRVFYAARLVATLEAYAFYDDEIGYFQGITDLLSPLAAMVEDDYEAFWRFVGFMKKARHNFRLRRIGIRRHLNTVVKIIKFKDSHLYRHPEKMQAEDCFFVYRMVVVLFRRELTFEQTICLWEVM